MQTKRLGCITPLGLLGSLIALLAMGVTGWTSGGALFSPGELSALEGPALGGVTSHAATGGRCEACHTAPWDPTSMSVRCLDCHQTVETEINDPATLHGGLMADRASTRPGEVNCRECHTEHHGPDAMLTRLDVQNFPHDLTGFSLLAHETHDNGIAFDCEDCHQGDFRRMQTIVCKDCHTELDGLAMDQHIAAFGLECLHCHDGVDRFGADFDHAQTGFALTGEHAALLCQDCHQGQTTPEELAATPQDCAACHSEDDPHEGQLGADCTECHTTDGWTPANFDHNQRTGFLLIGKHLEAACADCHIDNVYAGTQDTCIACHREDDEHQGQYGTDCAECHTPEAWEPATFDHAATAFPLTGQHNQVACLDCHVNGQFTGTPQQCAACHSEDDTHQGSLGTDCASCHSTDGWVPSTFDHARSVFQLTGAHVTAQCSACHVNGQFKGTPQQCAACHTGDDAHQGSLGSDCAACHTTGAWKPSTFDHARSAFQLTGAHSSVTCSACHTNNTFKGTPQQCIACHAGDDEHQGQFGTDCAACHSTSDWSAVTFNHANTAFQLTGAHSSVPCLQCHSGGQFSGTPTVCVQCHAEPQEHMGQFGTDCAMCHSTSAWEPAGYNGPHTFPMNHGDANSCRDCHPSSLTSWTCYNCHNQGEVAEDHQDEGIGDFSNCMRCHANGEEGDDDGDGGGEDRGGGGDDDDD